AVDLSKSVSQSSVDDFERIYDGYIASYKNGARIDSFAWPFEETWALRHGLSAKEGDRIKIVGGNTEGLRVVGETTLPSAVLIKHIYNTGAIISNGSRSVLHEIDFTDLPAIDN